MTKRIFKNVAVEFLEYAEAAARDFENRGFKISVEKDNLGFPYTPTLLCRRQSTTIIVEFYSQILMDRIEEWVAYAKSSGRDTRLAICLPPKAKILNKQEDKLRGQGVGLYLSTNNGLIEKIAPSDLALNIQLPALSSLPREVRELLGSAYEQFNRSHWREGFEDACQALENAAKKYFKTGCKKKRILLVRRKGSYTPTLSEVDRWTLGRLGLEFSNIMSQTHADQVIGQAIRTINKDRVRVVHHKSKAITENSLRKNVGKHMWVIIQALKVLV